MPVIVRAEGFGNDVVQIKHRLREEPSLRRRGVLRGRGEPGEHLGVHGLHLTVRYVRHVRDARDCGEPGGDRVPSHGRGGVHAAHDLDVLQTDKLLGVVVEAAVR